MNKPKINESAADEELIGVLTAISVVSKRLARNLIQLEQQKKSMEGATNHEQNTQSGTGNQRVYSGRDSFRVFETKQSGGETSEYL